MSATNIQSPRAAATTVLLRDGDSGLEVLLLRRHQRSGFAANRWVFPGGAVDESDCRLPAGRFRGIDLERLTGRFADERDAVLGFHVAAVRETFEEAGILLAAGRVDDADRRQACRELSQRGASATGFVDFLARHGLVLQLGALTYLARWITPRVKGRRYDTAFFVAHAPADQDARHDDVETTGERWVRPGEALACHEAGELPLMHPTAATLTWLAGHDSSDDAITAAARQPTIRWILPHVERDDGGLQTVLHPTDSDFPHALYASELRGPVR